MSKILKLLLTKLPLILILHAIVQVGQHALVIQEQKKSILDRLPDREQKIKLAKEKLDLAESYKKDQEQLRKSIDEVATQIEAVQKQLPNKIDDTEVMDYFTQEGKLLNLQDLFINRGEEVLNGFYYSKKFTIGANGTYLQLMVFFERLAGNERLFNVDVLKITAPKEKQKGQFMLVNLDTTLEAFRYNPSHREERGIENIGQNLGSSEPPGGPTPKKKKPRKKVRESE